MDIVLLTVCAAVVAVLASIVYISNRLRTYAMWFSLLCIALIVWVISNYLTNHYVGSDQLPATANVVAYVSALLAFYFGAMFSYNFPVASKYTNPEQQLGTFATAAVAVLSFSPVVSGYVKVDGSDISYTIGYGIGLYLIMMLVLLSVTSMNIFKLRKSSSKTIRIQAAVIGGAVIASGLLGLVLNIIVPMLGFGWDASRAGPISVLLFTGLVAYSIIRHSLFEVRLAALRTAGYIFALASLAGLYVISAYSISNIFDDQLVETQIITPAGIVLALALAIIFQPIKSLFDQLTDRMFYHVQYRTDDFIEDLGNALTSTVRLRDMLERASKVIAQTLRSSSVTFVVHRGARQDLVITKGRETLLSKELLSHVRQYIIQYPKDTFSVNELMSQGIGFARQLQKKHYEIILSLGEDVGYILIRERLGGGYSERDMRVLAAVSDELAIAIQNARSVEELRELNTTLQQRIDAATKELRQSNNQLKKLDETKDEFVSMASHQLRTPLTSVKGYISMVLEGDAGKITKQQEKLLSEAYSSSERMVRLIGDFLNVSRLQTGKFMIDSRTVDLAHVVAEEIDSIRAMAQAHEQELVYHGPKQPLEVTIDEDKTRQVIMNFIDNAIYYSPSNTAITVKLHASRGYVVFEVHDKGIGVPKEKQEQLFTKFFRADNARKQRPDGTGVGLFLAKKVIEAQDGEIIFHSREGMGSVFGFKLPTKK